MIVRIRRLHLHDADVSWRLRNEVEWKYAKCDTTLPATLDTETDCYMKIISDNSVRMFAILADNYLVGFCKLKNIANGAAELSYYMLRTDMMNKGICTAAVDKLISYGFDELGLDLIYRYVHKDNVPSIRMTKKQKFAPVGTSYLDSNVSRYEMTRTGWKNQKNALRLSR